MRKKVILNQNETLTQKLLEADSIIKSLKNSLADKDNEIRILKEKITVLEKSKIAEEVCEADDTTDFEEIAECDEKEEMVAQAVESEVTPVISEQDYHDFDFIEDTKPEKDEDINEYAVKIIGKIVSESVKINCVLASGNNENKKELINLVLGRTEVAKEEIFSILSTRLNADLLKTSIDKECAATLEYYQSILGQL